MKHTHEIRYVSESFGTLALYGKYFSEGAALSALIEFRRRAAEHGAKRILQSAHIKTR